MADESFQMSCPVPLKDYPRILLGHGSGGALTHDLISKIFHPAFDNPALRQNHDGAVVELSGSRYAFTTDSYVVQPLFFPGGDIGSLAVYGSVNDLVMCGARPLFLSVGFILEEGLEMEILCRIVESMKTAAKRCGVQIVTGDTKVVDKGKGDGVFINTAGIGVIEHGLTIAPFQVKTGDVIILSGDIGRHGMAIMAAREGLSFENTIQSDAAPLVEPVLNLIKAGIPIHSLRDLTRGGLATALVEIARTAKKSVRIDEKAISVIDEVRGACEILGLDPLYVANEGRFICIVPECGSDKALEILIKNPLGAAARVIGRVTAGGEGRVVAENMIGTSRLLDLLPGQLLPRIC